MTSRQQALCAMLGQTLLAGSGFSFAHQASSEFHPVALTILRMAGASLFFIGYLAVKGSLNSLKRPWQDYRKLSLLALFGVTINQFFFLSGMRYTLPANSALLYALTPLAVMLISVYVLRTEVLTTRRIVGLGLALSGAVIVLVSRGYALGFEPEFFFGNALISGAVLSWAIYIALGKPIMATLTSPLDAMASTGLFMMIGFLQFLPLALITALFDSRAYDLTAITSAGWIGFGYVTLFGAAIAYLFLTYAIAHLDAPTVSIFMNAQPAVAAAVSVIFLGEDLNTLFILGGVLAISGIVLTQQYFDGRHRIVERLKKGVWFRKNRTPIE